MIGSVKDVKIGDKTFTIKKHGVTGCMNINSIMLELVIKANIPKDIDLNSHEGGDYLQAGMRGQILFDIREAILDTVTAPRMGVDEYEELDTGTVISLLNEICDFNVGQANKKKEKLKSSSKANASVKNLNI